MSHLIAMIQQYGLGFVFLNVLALQAGLPVPAYPTLIVAGAYAASGGNPLWALVARRHRRRADRRHRLVRRRPHVRLAHPEHAVPRIAVAGFVRSSDGNDFPALRTGVDAVRQVRAGLRLGRDRAGRRAAPALLGFRAVRRHRRGAVGQRRSRPGLRLPRRDRRRDGQAGFAGQIRLDAGRLRPSSHGSCSNGGGAGCSSGSCAWTAFRSTSSAI